MTDSSRGCRIRRTIRLSPLSDTATAHLKLKSRPLCASGESRASGHTHRATCRRPARPWTRPQQSSIINPPPTHKEPHPLKLC
ncbi:hypothetical protein BIFGAL_03655 [Bifidobacterium gallicum DSM 20093 = LMG 11596]|uniref:Uncharacterized protein n=1 Tax=Bifidobacterium gallicum DSM 20093 = LMG 11596 TaxID=561180 RepID=D1NUX7_9BIFI|nr:hypothetical protein BIFGAL_03655 [Bifidobacterium gallicum DSM 20093 = LMG 11596]